MKIERFEDITAWQKSKELTLCIYSVFKTCKDFGFKNQIERASVSIMNNIAEGFERRTNKEMINFFFIAKGSTGEVRSMLELSLELNYINKKDFEKTHSLSIEISKMLSAFIKTIN